MSFEIPERAVAERVGGPDAVVVELTGFEIGHAGVAGVWRNVTAIRDHRPLEDGRFDLGFGRHVEGAIGEYAAAKALGKCWSPAVGILDTNTGDLSGVHVKATTRTDGSLIVRPHDPPELPYVLAILRLTDRDGMFVTLPGWIQGSDARDDRYWRDRDPRRGVHRAAWFVPQSDLRPLSELP